MSIMNTVTLNCPKCGKEHPFNMWKTLNTGINPEMRAAVKDKSAFLFECPDCGNKSYVDYGFL